MSFLVGNDIVLQFSELDYISRKDCIRAIGQETMKIMLKSLGIFKDVKILDLRTIGYIGNDGLNLTMPDEDISRLIAEKYFKKATFALNLSF